MALGVKSVSPTYLSVPCRGVRSITETQRLARNGHRRLETLQATSYFEPTAVTYSTRAQFLGLGTRNRKLSTKKTQAKRAHKLGHKSTLRCEEGSIEILAEHSKVTRSITQMVHVCAQNFQEESYRSAYPIAMRQQRPAA